MSHTRPAPDDFATFAPGKTCLELEAHYRAAQKTIARWRRETGVRAATHKERAQGMVRQAPPQFANMAPTMTIAALSAHFRAGRARVRRWLAELDIEPGKRSYPSYVPHLRRASNRNPLGSLKTQDFGAHGDGSLAQRAVDECLRHYAPVYRCDEAGKQDCHGRFWRVGSAVLTDDEIVARAQRKGWDADAWRRVAA